MKNTTPEPEGDSLSSPISVDIITESITWVELDIDLQSYFENLLKKTIHITSRGLLKTNIEVCVLLADDEKLQSLNSDFRHNDNPTNVLSFPNHEFYNGELIENKELPANLFLGDIALSFNTLHKESIEYSVSLKDHLTHMFIHSVLHLIGFTHDEAKEAGIMEELEIKILKSLDIANPYEESDE